MLKRSFIPMHSIIRIDEVDKEGQVKVSDIKSSDKVARFPFQGAGIQPGSSPQRD